MNTPAAMALAALLLTPWSFHGAKAAAEDPDLVLPPVGLEVAYDNGSVHKVEMVEEPSVFVRETTEDGQSLLHSLLGGLFRQSTVLTVAGRHVALVVTFDQERVLAHLPPVEGDGFQLPYETSKQDTPFGEGVSNIHIDHAGPLRVSGVEYPTVLVAKETFVNYTNGDSERIVSREWYCPALGLILQSETLRFDVNGSVKSRAGFRAVTLTFPASE